MSLDLFPDPAGLTQTQEAPRSNRPSPDVAQTNLVVPAAVTALPAGERAGLDAMTARMTAQLDAIRSGAEVPQGFAGALAAHDEVLTSLGIAIPETQADVRATLVAKTQSEAPGGRTLGQDPVARALGSIRESLSERGLDLDVSHSDLESIERTFRGLSPQNATAVARGLSDMDLQKWTSELNGTVGGYTPGEQRRLFDVLAARLDATQLKRFADALGTRTSSGERGQSLGLAIAAHAPESVRAAFVRGGASVAARDAEIGPAVGEVLASLRGATLNQTLGALQRAGTLAGVVEGSVRSDLIPNYGGGAPTITYDADTLGRVLRTASLSGDATAQAVLVDAASGQLKPIEDGAGLLVPTLRGDSVDQIRGGITSILRRDAAGVLGAFERTRQGGGAFPDYVASMIESGQSAEIGRMLVRVGTGNGTAQSAGWITQQRPGDVDRRGYYANAETLGFAVGSVSAAIDSISDSRRDTGNTLKDIFGVAAGAAGTVNAPAGVVASVLTGVVNVGVDAVVSRYVAGDAGLKESLTALAFPRNVDGTQYNGGASTPFGQSIDFVVDAQVERRRVQQR